MEQRVKQHHNSALIYFEEAFTAASNLANFLEAHSETEYTGDFSTVETFLDDPEAEERIEDILPELQSYRSGFLQESANYRALKKTTGFQKPGIDTEHKHYMEMFNDLGKEIAGMMNQVEKLLDSPERLEDYTYTQGFTRANSLYNPAD